MTISLKQRLENFDKLSDENRRAFISMLKVKKAKMETQLKQIEVILERYNELKGKRLEKRKEDIRIYWRGGVVLEDTPT